MKKGLRLSGIVIALLLLAGCVPSVHPLYTEADLIFEPALVGKWAEKDSTESWVFTKAGEKEYKLVIVDKDGEPGEFTAHLLRVQGRRFLDLYPASSFDIMRGPDYLKVHFMPVHTCLRVRELGQTLRLAFYDPKWAEEYLKKNPNAVKHEMIGDDGVLLTAQPKELQSFFLRIEKEKGALGDSATLLRRDKEGRVLYEAEKAFIGEAIAVVAARGDVQALAVYLHEDAERKTDGKGSALASLRRQPRDVLKDATVVETNVFGADDVDRLKERFPGPMWRPERIPAHLGDGVGCLLVIRLRGEQNPSLWACVIRLIDGRRQILYIDDN